MLAVWFQACLHMTWILLVGCSSTSLRRTDAARNAFAAGDLSAARENLVDLRESDRRQRTVSELDIAMVDLAAGNFRQAEGKLRELRDRFDAQPKHAPLAEAAALVSDDNTRVFRPAGYEQVMVRTMLAFCSLAGDGLDAEAYCLQAYKKQNDLGSQAKERGILDSEKYFQPIAIAPYLRGVIRESTHHDYDDATHAYKMVSAVEPNFAPAQADIQRASTGVHSTAGHGVLYVLAAVGRGPVLTEIDAPTTSESLKIASLILQKQTNDDDDSFQIPNIASVKVPSVIVPPSRIASVDVHSGSAFLGTTQMLTDVGQLAANQIAAEMPWTIARAVARRVTKEAAVAKVGNTMGLQGNAQSIFHFAAASLWSHSEDADTRCWGTLPREIQVLRAELPVGQQQITLSASDPHGHALSNEQATVQIYEGGNTYLIVIAPDQVLYLANRPSTALRQ